MKKKSRPVTKAPNQVKSRQPYFVGLGRSFPEQSL